ncbi:MAG: diguanylate cyclase response regulator [Oleiphilus sp.]|nr:MAG: diguanylate cyclase response regulator [Oleiphilus sp.]
MTKVLVADDDPVTVLLLTKTLADWGYEVVQAEDGKQAWEALIHDKSIRLVIVDWRMPELDGIQLCQKLKADSERFYYVVMLTSNTGTDNLVKSIEAGADDFISKPFFPEELRVRLRAGVRILEQESKLQFFANHDELTGIYNRRMILSQLEKEWQRSERENIRLMVLLMDLDKFKSVNDQYGHDIGDRMLQHFCDIVSRCIRPYDVVGRYGGEEFLVIMPLSMDADWHHAAERVLTSVAETPLVTQEFGELHVTVSIGQAEKNSSCLRLENLIDRADQAMYAAKYRGGNRLVAFDDLEERT